MMVLKISEQMLATNLNEPVELWVSGIVLQNHTNRVADAVQRLKRALENDLARTTGHRDTDKSTRPQQFPAKALF